MLYAINVLKKIIMKEKSYILFWKVKKMWILKHVCLQSTPWTMFCLMKSLCYYCPTFTIPVFSTAAILLLCYASSSIFSNSTATIWDFAQTIAFAQRMSVVKESMFSTLKSFCTITVAAAAAAAPKRQLSMPLLLTAWLVLIVCFLFISYFFSFGNNTRLVTWL